MLIVILWFRGWRESRDSVHWCSKLKGFRDDHMLLSKTVCCRLQRYTTFLIIKCSCRAQHVAYRIFSVIIYSLWILRDHWITSSDLKLATHENWSQSWRLSRRAHWSHSWVKPLKMGSIIFFASYRWHNSGDNRCLWSLPNARAGPAVSATRNCWK